MPRSHGVREAEGSTRPGDIVAGVVVHVVVAVAAMVSLPSQDRAIAITRRREARLTGWS